MDFKLQDLLYDKVIKLFVGWIICECWANLCNILVMWFQNITCILIIFYDDYICHKCFAKSRATSSYFTMKISSLMHCHVNINNHVAMQGCMDCDVFRDTYDKVERHWFSDECGARHKICDSFLQIVIGAHLTRTFCDDGLFITMASLEYNLWQKNPC